MYVCPLLLDGSAMLIPPPPAQMLRCSRRTFSRAGRSSPKSKNPSSPPSAALQCAFQPAPRVVPLVYMRDSSVVGASSQ